MNFKFLMRSACALGAALMISTSANAVPVFFAGTGNFYEHIGTTSTWTNARASALGMTHLGQPGYLATITSAAENTFLLGLAFDGWFGGTDQAVEGVWRWIDGPEAGVNFWNGGIGGSSPTFASWGGGEPNNSGNEDFVHLSGGSWNDLPNGNSAGGYFVEFNAPPPTSGIPEPATLILFGVGLLGLGAARRRKRQAA